MLLLLSKPPLAAPLERTNVSGPNTTGDASEEQEQENTSVNSHNTHASVFSGGGGRVNLSLLGIRSNTGLNTVSRTILHFVIVVGSLSSERGLTYWMLLNLGYRNWNYATKRDQGFYKQNLQRIISLSTHFGNN